MGPVFAPEDVRDLEIPAPGEFEHHRRLCLTLRVSSPQKLTAQRPGAESHTVQGFVFAKSCPINPRTQALDERMYRHTMSKYWDRSFRGIICSCFQRTILRKRDILQNAILRNDL